MTVYSTPLAIATDKCVIDNSSWLLYDLRSLNDSWTDVLPLSFFASAWCNNADNIVTANARFFTQWYCCYHIHILYSLAVKFAYSMGSNCVTVIFIMWPEVTTLSRSPIWRNTTPWLESNTCATMFLFQFPVVTSGCVVYHSVEERRPWCSWDSLYHFTYFN